MRAAEEAKGLASVNGLTTLHQELPVSFTPEEDEFRFRAATSFEINRIVQSFSSNKAPGKDKLHMAVVKDALPAILPISTEIINSSLLTSVFPSPWQEFDRRTLITIINSLVFRKLLYCSSVWANTTKKNIDLLQTVQNFAARIVSGTRKFDHVTPILKQLQWLPIVKQLEVRDATMVFK